MFVPTSTKRQAYPNMFSVDAVSMGNDQWVAGSLAEGLDDVEVGPPEHDRGEGAHAGELIEHDLLG